MKPVINSSSSRMRTAFLVPVGAGFAQTPPRTQTPPLEADHHPGGWSCDQCCMLVSQPLTHVNRMTDKCKNITLSQTSFAGGNKTSAFSLFSELLVIAL